MNSDYTDFKLDLWRSLEEAIVDTSLARREQEGDLGINDWAVRPQKGHSLAQCRFTHSRLIQIKISQGAETRSRLPTELLKSLPLAGVSFWKAENVKRTFLLFAVPGMIFTQPDLQASLVSNLVVNGCNTSSAECVHVTQWVLTDETSTCHRCFCVAGMPSRS